MLRADRGNLGDPEGGGRGFLRVGVPSHGGAHPFEHVVNTAGVVAVVGGGPGGSAAAIRCAQAGLRVVLLERERFPREHPGETLHPGIEPLLDSLGVGDAVRAAAFLRHPGHWVQTGGGLRFLPFGSDDQGPWRGFQAWRAEFDQILLDQAKATGVEVRQPCRALRPVLDGGRVCGVETDSGRLSCTVLVDAAGGQGWLARHLDLPVRRESERLMARYGYVSGTRQGPDPLLVRGADGWHWTAQVQDDKWAWTSVERSQDDVHERSVDVTWRITEPAAGAGYFLVGDAAAVLDPTSSHGVLKAVMSGIYAGHLIAAVRARPETEAAAAQEYTRWVTAFFEHDVKRLREL